MGIITENIRSKLNDQFSPQLLEIEDQSESHRGHVGHREGGETHFHVRLISSKFEGQNRVQRQRLVYAVLADELAGPIHALSLELKAPSD
ncbi:MAG: BolA family protein [Rhodospirillales bacterium]|jgi:BolA protein